MDKEITNKKLRTISIEEKMRLENEIRSNLRYSWQKTTSYIVYYNPPISEIEEQLKENFLQFIPLSFPKRKKIEEILTDSFVGILEKLLNNKEINSVEIEEQFIEITISKFKGILF